MTQRNAQRIWDALMTAGMAVTVGQLAETTGFTAGTVRKWLRWWEHAGYVATVQAGRGREKPTPHI